MTNLLRIINSEWIKTKRTPVQWISFIIPILYTLMLIWYFSMLKREPNLNIKVFETFFIVWTSLFTPIGVGLLSGLVIYQEEQAGSFSYLFGSIMTRGYMYLGKLTMTILLYYLSTLIALLLLIIGINFLVRVEVQIPINIFILSFLMTGISILPLISFHIWISFAYGIGSSIAVGGVGILIASLIGATSLGNNVWHLVPWAWPVRLSQLPILFLPETELPSHIIPLKFYWSQTLKGLIPAVILFIVFTILGIIWFNKWEGRKKYD